MADPDNPSELTGQEVGLFAVHTPRSVHYFNLLGNGQGAVTREPGHGVERSVLDVPHQLQEILTCQVGAPGEWTLHSEHPLLEYHGRTSRIVAITREPSRVEDWEVSLRTPDRQGLGGELVTELTAPAWLFDGEVDDLDSRVLDQGHWWVACDQRVVAIAGLSAVERQQLLADLLVRAFDVRVTAMVDAALRMDAATISDDRIEYQLACDRVDELSALIGNEAWLLATPLAQSLRGEL